MSIVAASWHQPPPAGCSWEQRGRFYLRQMQRLADVANCVAAPEPLALAWIGGHVHRLNQALGQRLQLCAECYAIPPAADIFAVPLSPSLPVEGLCSQNRPSVLLIDAGRLQAVDWLGVVAHEFAHAVAGAGHGPAFRQALTHLCLGLGLPVPPSRSDASTLKHWPPHPGVVAERFWYGEVPF